MSNNRNRWASILGMVVAGAAWIETRPVLADSSPSLGQIQWAGAGISQAPKGKSTVVMTYVTWCPKCNVWAPEMIKQLQAATKDKPVVIVAIATDVTAAQGKAFLTARGLAGPNVVYGASPTANEALGMDSKQLWNFALIGTDGAVRKKVPAGSYYEDGDKQAFALPRDLSKEKDLGKFDFLVPEMSSTVKAIVWQMEMGDLSILPQIANPKNLRGLNKDDQQVLKEMTGKFLDSQLADVKTMAEGDVPKKIEAVEKAAALATHFRDTPQAKEAQKVAAPLSADAAMRKEMAAKKLYLQVEAKADGDEAKLAKAMKSVVQRFPDTYYGGLAQQATEAKPAK